MARRVVQTENKKGKPIKKKRHGCRNCLIALLVFVIVIGAGVYFTGDYFTKKYLNTPLASCFGVLGDLRSAKQKKIVTNTYSDKDLTALNKAFKQQLFLKDDVDFGIEKLITALTDNTQDGQGTQDEEKNAEQSDYLTATASALSSGFNTDGFVSELTKLYIRDNMDIQRLAAYDKDKHDEYLLRVSDKMLAAAINAALDPVAQGVDSVASLMEKYGIEKLSDAVRFEQLIFGTHDGTKDGMSAKVPTVTATLSVDARTIANNYLHDLTGRNLNFLSVLFLPKRVYVTAVLPIEENTTVENNLYVNNMNDAKMDRAYKLIGNVMSIGGEAVDFKSQISSAVQNAVSGVLGQLNTLFPIDKAQNGTVTMDVFETVIDLGGLNKNSDGELKPDEEQLHASDMISMLAGVVASEADDALREEYDYNHQYYDNNQNKVVYVRTPNPGDAVEGMTWVDYKQLFMQELAQKYMLDLTMGTDDPADDVTFDDLMRLFGLGDTAENETARDLQLLDLFDASRLDTVPSNGNRVQIDSRMLGAIMQTQIDRIVTDGSTLADADPVLEYVYTYYTVENDVNHNMMQAAISVNVGSLLKSAGGVGSIVTGLIGERVALTIDVDITPATTDDFAYIDGTLSYNGLTVQKTNDILRTISFFVSDFDTAGILEQVQTPIRNVIGEMNKVIPVHLCSSQIDGEATGKLPSALELDDVFTTVKNFLFAEDDQVTAEGIEKVLRGVYEGGKPDFLEKFVGENGMTVDKDGKPSYAASLKDVIAKYYIADKGYNKFDDIFGENGILSAESFAPDNFRLQDFYDENKEPEALRPLFSDNDLAALLVEQMEKESETYDDLKNVLGVKVEKNGDDAVITLYIALDVKSFLSSDNADQARLMPTDKLYLKASITTGTVRYYNKSTGELYEGNTEGATAFYDTHITVNNMDDDTLAMALRMLGDLNGNSLAIDLSVQARHIGAVAYDRIKAMESALGGNVTFENGGVRLMSLYDYLGMMLGGDENATKEDVRAAVRILLESKNTEKYEAAA